MANLDIAPDARPSNGRKPVAPNRGSARQQALRSTPRELDRPGVTRGARRISALHRLTARARGSPRYPVMTSREVAQSDHHDATANGTPAPCDQTSIALRRAFERGHPA